MMIISTALDPRFKLLAFRTDEQANNAKKLLISAVTSEINVLKEKENRNIQTRQIQKHELPLHKTTFYLNF